MNNSHQQHLTYATIAAGNAPQTRRSATPIWLAGLWAIGLFLLLPAINVNRADPPPAGTFLIFQAIATAVSVAAGSILLFRPRKRWLLINIPFVMFLAYVTGTVWTHFP